MIKQIVVILALGAIFSGVYKLAFAEPPRAAAHPAATPTAVPMVTVFEKQIVVDLAGGRYATLTAGLEVPPKWEVAIADSGIIREVVTRDMTGLAPEELLVRERRDLLKVRLARDIRAQTEVNVGHVLLTDFTVR